MGDLLAGTLAHRVDGALVALRQPIRGLFALSEIPEARDLLIDELSDIYGAQLALKIVTERVEARDEANGE